MTTDLINHNPMLKKPLLVVLAACEHGTQITRLELEACVFDSWSNEFTQNPAVSIDILVRNGALFEQLYVDGEPYDGTLEDLQVNADVAVDAVAESRLSITDTGRELLATYAPEATLQALLTSKPRYRDVFNIILHTCDAEQGASRADLEQAISSLPQLQPEPATQQTAVYPQYFIDALESAGGIVWQGSWHLTNAGKAILAA
ncbi:MAG: hypothetical protein RSB04_06740 [Gordonibacter sp.]|uniref:hypothetical protein n=1 Tax=Gordonibacter sp. TaxID=1968902 RepID=UPI002FC70C67